MAWVLTQGAGATPTQATVASIGTTTLTITPTAIGAMLFCTGAIAYAGTTLNTVVSNLSVSDSVDGSWTVVCNNNSSGVGTKMVSFVAYKLSTSSTAARTVTLSNASTSNFGVNWALAEATHVGFTPSVSFTELNNLSATNTSVTLSGGSIPLANHLVILLGANGNGTNGTGWTSPSGASYTTLYNYVDVPVTYADVLSLVQINPATGAYSVTFTDNAGAGNTGFPSALAIAFSGPQTGNFPVDRGQQLVLVDEDKIFQLERKQPPIVMLFGRPATTYAQNIEYWRPRVPPVEAEEDQAKRTDMSLRLLMYGRPATLSPAFASFIIAPKPPPASLFFDTFTLAYTVTEAYQQVSQTFGVTELPNILLYTKSNRVLEDEWPYPKTDHSVLNQFRWNPIGLLRGYSFDVPDLNDDPWLEWQPNRADKAAALYPFRQITKSILSNAFYLTWWQSKNWAMESEPDIIRKSDHSLGPMLFFGKPKELPSVTMPGLIGNTLSYAQSVIAADNLVLGTVTYIFTTTQPAGIVTDQLPVAGLQVGAGTIVTLTVSLGPQAGKSLPFQGNRVTTRQFSLEEMVSRAWGSEFKAPDHRIYVFGGGQIGKDSTDMGTTGFYKPPGYKGTSS